MVIGCSKSANTTWGVIYVKSCSRMLRLMLATYFSRERKQICRQSKCGMTIRFVDEDENTSCIRVVGTKI